MLPFSIIRGIIITETMKRQNKKREVTTMRYVKKGTLIIDTETNKKMYPVGKWIKYSHIFYNYDDICYNNMYEKETEESYSKFEESQELLEKFESNPRINEIVYAYYEDYKKMRDIISAYVYRHNGVI